MNCKKAAIVLQERVNPKRGGKFMKTIARSYFLFLAFLLFAVAGYSQDVDKVRVSPRYNQSESEMQRDQNQCYSNAEANFDHSKHKTLKNTGAGAAGGGIVGGIFGKGGAGAAIGGAAGAYRGHKRSKEDKNEFNTAYASCLRDKGYSVTVDD
jgi:hypothetical protein